MCSNLASPLNSSTKGVFWFVVYKIYTTQNKYYDIASIIQKVKRYIIKTLRCEHLFVNLKWFDNNITLELQHESFVGLVIK